jgi:thiosulfate dehydrogenase [quinone] large subunit
MAEADSRRRREEVLRIEDSPIARAAFGDVRWAWIWLVARLYVGAQWLRAGWGKLNSSAWIGAQAGSALSGFVEQALPKATGAHPDVQGWYAWFLQNVVLTHASFWSYLVTGGEFLVGVTLILGLFTGIASFFGLFMNMNYLLAGTVSTNPVMLVVAILLAIAWKTAGWWGLDRWLMPALGTPWAPGYVFRESPGGKPLSTQAHPR